MQYISSIGDNVCSKCTYVLCVPDGGVHADSELIGMKHIHFEVPITKSRFLIVFIWRRKGDFRKATDSKKDGCFLSDTYRNNMIIGQLHFVKGLIGSGIVAHEILHAAKQHARMMGKKKNEEYLASTCQVMTSNFWCGVRRDKTLNRWIYKDE